MKTADLCDDYAEQFKLCKMDLSSYGGKKEFHGFIQTVEVFEDNSLVKESLQTIEPGTVLVVDGAGSRNCALLGDLLASIAADRQINGIIINGCVRDSAELTNIPVGIKAIGTCPFKSKKRGEGKKNIHISFGDIEWVPGQYVYADDDGILVAEKPVHI